jgi:hypothetical protein
MLVGENTPGPAHRDEEKHGFGIVCRKAMRRSGSVQLLVEALTVGLHAFREL